MNRKLLGFLAILGLAACDGMSIADPGPRWESSQGVDPVKVLTRNLYLGADLDPIIGAPSPGAIPVLAAAAWASVQASDIPSRAALLAAEIAAGRPDLVGLQEAVTYYIQHPGDAAFGGTIPASTPVYDFVALLLAALEERGLHYRQVSNTVSFDVEVPVYTGAVPIPFDDIRLTDHEVVLAAEGVDTSNPMGSKYVARLVFPIGGPGGPTVQLTRAWSSVDVSLGGGTFRFLSTHLEVQPFAPIQVVQATELIGIANASPYPVALVGDFNSDADGSQTPTYQMIANAGYQDVWGSRPHGDTCCHDKDLHNRHANFDQRLDIVFMRGFEEVGNSARVVGDNPGARRGGDLWPSDHAGVMSHLRLR
jgi:endonuclease/exonuclease/phosphatase family metal-dependent hydrolase